MLYLRDIPVQLFFTPLKFQTKIVYSRASSCPVVTSIPAGNHGQTHLQYCRVNEHHQNYDVVLFLFVALRYLHVFWISVSSFIVVIISQVEDNVWCNTAREKLSRIRGFVGFTSVASYQSSAMNSENMRTIFIKSITSVEKIFVSNSFFCTSETYGSFMDGTSSLFTS